jgi:dipeptidyl aminopeptidase/acylaminoacyl peptidase
MHLLCLAVLALGSVVSAGVAEATDSLDAMRTRLGAARARIDAQTKLYHDPVGPRTWIDGARLWYAESSPSGERRWWLVDARAEGAAARRPLFDHDEAARLLPPPDGGAVSAARLPVQGVAVENGMVVVSFESVERPKVFDLETGRHRTDAEAGSDAAAALELRLSPARARSVGQGASSGITFVNTLDEEVEILWVDARGQAKPYGRVPARGERRQHTFGGHAWMVRTASGEELGFAVASDVEKTLRIARAPAAGNAGAHAAREPEAVDQTDGQKETQDGESRDGAGDGDTPPAAAAVEIGHDGPNLVIRAGGREIFRTSDGVDGDGYTGGAWVSPARDAVVALKVKRGARHPVHIVDAAPKDRLEPKLRTLDYTKPGDEIDRPVPRLFRLERASGGAGLAEAPAGALAEALAVREVAVDAALVANPWSLDRARFISGGREIAFLYNQRGHQVVRLVALDLASGAMRTIAEQSYPTFVDWTNKVWMHWLDATGELLWMTERSGWSHLELVDVATGTVKRRVTDGAWNVRRVEHVDERARTVDIALMGRDATQDPYHLHFARVAIDAVDGSGGLAALTMLTSGNGTCRVDFSPDRSALVCVRARADIPPVYELRRASDGAVVAELGAGDARAMREAGWIPPQPFMAKGRDGKTAIWGLVYRPSGFDPAKKYPVIENIYAGPHGQHVPKWFDLRSRSREYAELGAIVVQIDGMGTNWRGKAFHDLCWKNLKDAGFPDRIAWMRELASRDASVDLSRVAIFGGSAGGQNAMRAVIDHADFYRAAVADCGCHDNRMDKIWWNEQWMGWPVDESYAASSNMEDAARLGGALMLVVGGLDENVDPATTMQVTQRLIDAGKDFELLVIPGAGHGAAEGEYGNLRRARFLFRAIESDAVSGPGGATGRR